MSELKPCPFCGIEPVITVRIGLGKEYTVQCYESSHAKVWASTEEKAIKAWNTRYERTCKPTDLYNNIFECDKCKEIDTDGIPRFCPGCGARVINED